MVSTRSCDGARPTKLIACALVSYFQFLLYRVVRSRGEGVHDEGHAIAVLGFQFQSISKTTLDRNPILLFGAPGVLAVSEPLLKS